MQERKKFKVGKYLYFSRPISESFYPGSHFSYLVTKDKIIIMADEKGKRKVSKRRNGRTIRNIFDLRAKDVISALQGATEFKVTEENGRIIVSLLKRKRTVSISKESSFVSLEEYFETKRLCFSKDTLTRLAAGYGTHQLTFDEVFSKVDWRNNGHLKEQEKILKEGIKNVYDVVSLFSGAGMLDYPFKLDPSFRIIFGNDYDLAATESYRANIGNHIICSDIRSIHAPRADVIIGGPSCKPFSLQNTHKRLTDHKDFWLIKEYTRIIRETDPKVFVIENVPNFLSKRNEGMILSFKENFSDYDLTFNILCDDKVGGYTKRKRAIIIGSKIGSIKLPDITILPKKTVKDALSKVDASWYNYYDVPKSTPRTVKRFSYIPDGGTFCDVPDELKEGVKKRRFSNCCIRLAENTLAPTITEVSKNLIAPPLSSPSPNRCLSVAEASALQGFDKNFRFLETNVQMQQQVANGVPFFMGKFIKDTIKRALDCFFTRKPLPE